MEEAGRAGCVRSRPANLVQPQKLGHRITAAIFRAVILHEHFGNTDLLGRFHCVVRFVYAVWFLMKLCVFLLHTRSYHGLRNPLACWTPAEEQLYCKFSSAWLVRYE